MECAVNADDLEQFSDVELQRLRERLVALVPDMTHAEALTYEQTADKLGVKYERVAGLVSSGVLVAEKHQHDARKWLSSDQVAWYRLKQRGKDEGLPNPALLRQEMSIRATQAQPKLRDTLAEVRAYVAEHMAGSQEASQLDTLLAKVAGHIAVTLALSTSESLPQEEREQLAALLAALTSKGR
jgi:hypothetical protein